MRTSAHRRPRGFRPWLPLTLAMLASLPFAGSAASQGQEDAARITVTFTDQDTDVDITSSKPLARIDLRFCNLTGLEEETVHLDPPTDSFQYTGDRAIDSVLVHPAEDGNTSEPPQRFLSNVPPQLCVNPAICESPEFIYATAHEGPRNEVDWFITKREKRLYRAVGSGSFTLLAEIPESLHNLTDTDVDAGVTYRYRITSLTPEGEASACWEAQVTSIPVLPGITAMAAAAVGGAGAYAWARRRR